METNDWCIESTGKNLVTILPIKLNLHRLFQHSHSRTAVCNSRREVDMSVHVVLNLRACTYRYRCLISKICVLLTQIFLDMCIAVCLPGQLVNRYSFCVSDDLFYMLFLQ